jgi:hypothetical protein
MRTQNIRHALALLTVLVATAACPSSDDSPASDAAVTGDAAMTAADGAVTADGGVTADSATTSDTATTADSAPTTDTAPAAGAASGTVTGTVTINGATEDFNCNVAENTKASNATYNAAANLLTVACATSQGIITVVSAGMPAAVGVYPQSLMTINNVVTMMRYTTQFFGSGLGSDPAHPTYTNTVTTWDLASGHLTGESEATFATSTAPGTTGAFKVKFDVIVKKL